MDKVAKQTKVRRHQAIIICKCGEYKEEGY